jgi:hypothetical protein
VRHGARTLEMFYRVKKDGRAGAVRAGTRSSSAIAEPRRLSRYLRSEVQWPQRVAFIGIVERQ